MRARLPFGLALLLVALTVVACGCPETARVSTSASADAPPPSQTAVDLPIAEVDSLGVPARIETTDTLTVHLTGTVGPNGCYSLARIETERAPGQIVVRPLVQPPRDENQMCTMALVPLDETHRVAPPFEAGTLTVVVPQQNRPAVTAAVEVTGRPE